jgi:selenide,water dikinase
MQEFGANGCTDITGFGLLGHAFEMAKASNVTFKIESEGVPLLPDVIKLIEQEMLTRGDKNNRTYVGETVKFDKNVTKEMQSALFDPQTAGGLLISLEAGKAEKFIEKLKDAKIIGRVESYKDYLIEVS